MRREQFIYSPAPTRKTTALASVSKWLAALKPMQRGAYSWYEFSVEKLKEGENTFELWTDHTAMAGWSLAMEAGHPAPDSAISDDGGQTWRSERMGYLNAVLGEYVIRIRLAEAKIPHRPLWYGKTRIPQI